ncbi:hypothetical protein EU78_29075 [Mycolicibacterium rufum]|nr:hypothetical protein EU78_29075 [Mycolicibacterium rufum]
MFGEGYVATQLPRMPPLDSELAGGLGYRLTISLMRTALVELRVEQREFFGMLSHECRQSSQHGAALPRRPECPVTLGSMRSRHRAMIRTCG